MKTPRIIHSVARAPQHQRPSTICFRTSTSSSSALPCLTRSQSTATATKELSEPSTIPSQTTPAETSLRRFWKTVDVHKQEDGQYSIRLDLRNLKTPSGKPLVLPKTKLVLATLIAREWDEQRKILKQHSLPMTSLASRAIDGLSEAERDAVVDDLMRYLDTDTICFQESKPRVLAEMQKTHWAPLLVWLQEAYGIHLRVHEDSIVYSKQSPETHSKLRALVAQFDPLKLAAFERAVHATKSFVIALALVQNHLTVDQASDASRVEVLSQIARWGEVEDTHDVDYQEIRMKLGSVSCAIIDTP
ncbi:ATP synthase complex assembly protein atp12 [Puccinia graminis f. sp. tritici]|uniref:ATP synthase complex assembly protein atp12 n=1 Tax=Puccinia graminis f. sp. tritici TaxID=56615 RepID=A0A5B0Q1F6_PUCGR|nr:ATP synthase complex assembly protein atp12 [Puccinia graminis f. sp. tritici]